MTALPLIEWRDFYVMIGTAAGVIIGATFVVASLATGMKERAVGMAGFITPTAVHLGSVLVACAILTAPTLTPLMLAILLGVGGFIGACYGFVVARRIWGMKLGLDDRLFYVIMPIVAYAVMGTSAILMARAVQTACEILAVSLVVLLLVGMRNSWDMANFMITRDRTE